MDTNSRFEQLKRAEHKGALAVAFIASFLGGTTFFHTVDAYGWIVAALIGIMVALCTNFIGQLIRALYLLWKYYNFQLDELIADVNEATLRAQLDYIESQLPRIEEKAFTMTIVGLPEKPIGKFKDAAIFDWIDFQGSDGVTRRYNYHSIVNDYYNIDYTKLPENAVILPPGLVYQVDASHK